VTAALPVIWVDSFSDRPFAGNPAAVCILDEPLDEALMQRVAMELGLSETAYVVPGDGAWSLRWFTPSTEVSLCGHATVAAAHALHEAGRTAEGETVGFDTRSGRLTATVVGGLVEIDLPAAPPVPVDVPDALGALAGDVVAAHRGGMLLLELADDEAVRAFVPDLDAFHGLADDVVLVTAAASAPDVDYVLRVFGPKVGIDEDPVTGSAPCTAGPFWAERLGKRVLESRQLSTRGGSLRVTVDRDRVRVGGPAVTVLRGTMQVPSP
jgi:PhzF family phenazine biosynthesis protein